MIKEIEKPWNKGIGCSYCSHTASMQVADNSLTKDYVKCPHCGTKYNNKELYFPCTKVYSLTYSPCITMDSVIVNFVLYTPHRYSIKRTCPICLQLMSNKELYNIVTGNLLFPSRLAHKDCVENFKGGNSVHIDIIPYYNVIEFLYKDYIRGKAYHKKYAHWFK